jgi:hypothetical protein
VTIVRNLCRRVADELPTEVDDNDDQQRGRVA